MSQILIQPGKTINEHIEINQQEIEDAMKTLKNDKTPGEDGITNEIIKHGGHTLTHHICQLFNLILQNNTIPKEREMANIILLH